MREVASIRAQYAEELGPQTSDQPDAADELSPAGLDALEIDFTRR